VVPLTQKYLFSVISIQSFGVHLQNLAWL